MGERKAAKKPVLQDWHRADIVAGLRKAGWSVRRLAKHHGYASHGALTVALARPFPKAQRLIAEAIGVAPEQIWPSRYERKACAAGCTCAPADSSPDTHFLTRQSSEVRGERKQVGGSSRAAGSEVVKPSLEQAAA